MASTTVELHPFAVPNFVNPVVKPCLRQEGFKETTGIPLSQLEASTLEELCDDFRKQVFNKAGKVRPPRER